MNEPTFTGTCAGCGAPNGLYQPGDEAYYCPTCAKKNDEFGAAAMHISSLVSPVLTAWYQHWRARGVETDTLLRAVTDEVVLSDMVTALIRRENPKAEAAVLPDTLNRAAHPQQLEVAA